MILHAEKNVVFKAMFRLRPCFTRGQTHMMNFDIFSWALIMNHLPCSLCISWGKPTKTYCTVSAYSKWTLCVYVCVCVRCMMCLYAGMWEAHNEFTHIVCDKQ